MFEHPEPIDPAWEQGRPQCSYQVHKVDGLEPTTCQLHGGHRGIGRLLNGLGSDQKGFELRSSRSTIISLPPTGDVAGTFKKKTRQELYRVLRKNERETEMRLRPISREGLDAAVIVHAEQHIQRWGSKGGSIFQCPENVSFLKEVVREAYNGGFGYGYELLFDDQIAAQNFGFLENGTAFGYRTGMNDMFRNRSPGLVLIYHVVNEMRNEGKEVFNLGEGDEKYKDHLGGKEGTLIGGEARRGLVSLLSSIRGSSVVRMSGFILGLKGREDQGQ